MNANEKQTMKTQTQTIDVMNMNEFLGHDPRICEMCEHRQAAVLMVARHEDHTTKTHVCLTCFELAESGGFADYEKDHLSPDRFNAC